MIYFMLNEGFIKWDKKKEPKRGRGSKSWLYKKNITHINFGGGGMLNYI